MAAHTNLAQKSHDKNMAEEQTSPNSNNQQSNSDVSEVSTPQNDDILKQLSNDYAEYMKLDIKKEVSF